MTVLLDTGPLVAALNDREQHHRRAVEQLQQHPGPLLTCEPVLTEAAFLGAEVVDPDPSARAR